MKIAVFDTHVIRPDSRVMHFDILVQETDKVLEKVLQFGRKYLAARGLPADSLQSKECRFCHVESATEPIEEAVLQDGFAIIEIANCN